MRGDWRPSATICLRGSKGVQEVKRWMAERYLHLRSGRRRSCAVITSGDDRVSALHPAHVNQTFTGCGFAAGRWQLTGGQQTWH